MSATMTATRISLELGCSEACTDMTGPLFLQLSHGYEECSVQPLVGLDEWRDAHRTARKRADRAARRGYRFTPFLRHKRVDDMHVINISASHRQGRAMSDSYRRRPSDTPLPEYPCSRHRITFYGVENRDGELVAYVGLYRAGQLALVSQILGHADLLEDEIMYLLVQGVMEREAKADPDGFLVYNRHDSGTDGLRFFKERLGFRPERVEWAP